MRMFPSVALAPAAVGLVALLGRVFPAGDRVWARLVASLGLLVAVPLPFVEGSWRSIEAARPVAIAAAGAVAAAWICVLIVPGRPAWRTTVLTGVAATGVTLAILSAWTVPALLFLGCAVLACAADLLLQGERRAALALSVGGVSLGSAVALTRGSSWAFPENAGGAWAWAAPAGLALVLLAAHLVCSRRPSALAPILPLVVAGVQTMARLLDGPHPWVATGALAAGSIIAVVVAGTGRDGLVLWAGSVALATVLVVPGYALAATLALLLALLARAGRGEEPSYGPLFRAAVPGFLPLTLGFVLVAAVGRRAFEAAVSAPDGAASAPWAAAGVVLLVALAAGLWLALGEADPAVALPVARRAAAPSAIAGASFLFATWPQGAAGLDRAPLGAEGGVFILHITAIGAGIAAAWFVYSREDATIGMVDESLGEPAAKSAPVPSEPRSLAVLTGVLLGLGAAAAVWLTIEGFRAGFQ